MGLKSIFCFRCVSKKFCSLFSNIFITTLKHCCQLMSTGLSIGYALKGCFCLMWVTRCFARWNYPMGWDYECKPLHHVRARFWLVIIRMTVTVFGWWKNMVLLSLWIKHSVIYDPNSMIWGPVSLSSGGQLLVSTRMGELLFCDRQP